MSRARRGQASTTSRPAGPHDRRGAVSWLPAAVTGLLLAVSILAAPIVRRVLPGRIESAHPSSVAQSSDADKTAQKIVDDRLAQLVRDRQSLVRDAKLGAILLAVLLILYREYMPMVAADAQLENQFGDQVSSLVHVEGYVNQMNQVVTDGFATWEARVQKRLDTALRDTIALDDYSQRLAASSLDSRPTAPVFLTKCANGDTHIAAWLETADPTLAPWEQIVTRCIIEPIDAGNDWEERGALSAQLLDARDQVNAALAQARVAFQIAPVIPTVIPTPTSVSQNACAPVSLARGPDQTGEPTAVAPRPISSLPGPSAGGDGIRTADMTQSVCPEILVRPDARDVVARATASVPDSVAIAKTAFVPPSTGTSAVNAQPAQIVIVVTQTTEPEPTPTPTAVPLTETLDDIGWEVNWTAQIIESLPGSAIRPPPSTWWELFTQDDGSLRSFRDNLLLVYASPFGSGQTARSLVSQEQQNVSVPSRLEPASGAPGVALRPLLGDLAGTLSRVRDEQERLQADIATQTAELEAAIPDFAKPVLAVARPRYLVLGYPLLVMAVGAYLAISYTVLQRQTRRLRQEYAKGNLKPTVLEIGVAELPGMAFVVMAGVPILLLVALLVSNDWPQLIYGPWQWTHVASIAVLVAVVLACAFVLRLIPKTGTSDELIE
jgi:hypothetical protein